MTGEKFGTNRSDEARAYDGTDWPGGSSFHPPHIEELFKGMGKVEEVTEAWPSDATPETNHPEG